jgi:murein DD-endopeptidase MepM/ murein hydrolase activator NlpD
VRSKQLLLLCLLAAAVLAAAPVRAQETQEPPTHLVEPGDTWTALTLRYGTSAAALQAANPHPNPLRQPVIGTTITLPADATAGTGTLHRPEGSLLRLALETGQNVATLAQLNGVANPYRPLYSRAVLVPNGEAIPRDLPPGFLTLELSEVPAQPGHAIAYRATTTRSLTVTAALDNWVLPSFGNGTHLVGIGGTGAFFYPGAPELTIHVEGQPLWSQPWRFQPGAWDYDQLTLTGAAAQIDQAAIIAEGERLAALWAQWAPLPQWHDAFQVPIDNYLEVSSRYGARRSYNGGPYRTYHEGVDFSAYRGTPVYATAAGTVVLAEMLYVRGGAVIIDHGLGIYSGYYHMSAVHATPGQQVQAGDQVGEVGTEGLSTGNHLHWDLLAAGTWIDAAAWEEQDLGCWLLAGWGTPCP